MRRTKFWPLAVIAAITLQGCAPELMAANERGGIVRRGTGNNEGPAFALADAHCHKFGRAAQVTGINILENRLAFACVEP